LNNANRKRTRNDCNAEKHSRQVYYPEPNCYVLFVLHAGFSALWF
jgi:hypothetical protein